MKLTELQIENYRCIERLTWKLSRGLNVLAGENDAGKTAIVDAIHLVLGSVAQEQTSHVVAEDFRRGTKELRVTCKFDELTDSASQFIEYLTYEGSVEMLPCLYISMQSEWRENERWPINTRFLCGKPTEIKDKKAGGIAFSANGGPIEFEARNQLRATYLKPLRDADRELKARRGSRLSSLIYHLTKNSPSETDILKGIEEFEKKLQVDFSKYTVRSDKSEDHGLVLKQLLSLLFEGERETTNVKLGLTSEQKLKDLLERLDLGFSEGDDLINRGLGYSNLLFIAAELSLFDTGFKLLMIEEPEAHLHPQRQLKLAQHLSSLSEAQIVLTTHSPNLASQFEIGSITVVRKGDVFSLDEASTKLTGNDRKFLQRFLDVTKANLFFARGVVLVEGVSEELLLPTLAKLLRRDFTDNGVSVVDVGNKAATRYARVFLRTDGKDLLVPVAILTDKDIVPAAMKAVHTNYSKQDAGSISPINEGPVKTFISDYWTFEYDLALGDGQGNSLACEMLQALYLLQGAKDYTEKGETLYQHMLDHFVLDYEKAASQIMYIFDTSNTVKEEFKDLVRKEKPEMAQALAVILEETRPENLEQKLPKYIVAAISHVVPVVPAVLSQ